jgi:hypothetical protein
MDVGHWGLPAGSKFPSTAISLGGRFTGEPDQGQCANTQVAVFQYGDIPYVFEVRGLKSPPLKGVDIGNIFVLEGGEIRDQEWFPKGSDKGEKLPDVEFSVNPGGAFRSFIEAVKARDPKKLNAPPEAGYYSSVLCHLANASHRVGEKVTFNKKSAYVEGNKAAAEAFDRMREHLQQHGVDVANGEYTHGKVLHLADPASWKTDDEKANAILAGSTHYRAPFSLPSELIAAAS